MTVIDAWFREKGKNQPRFAKFPDDFCCFWVCDICGAKVKKMLFDYSTLTTYCFDCAEKEKVKEAADVRVAVGS